MIEDFLAFSFQVIIRMTMVIVNLILTPVDALINTAMPSLGDAFANIGELFEIIGTYLGFAISLTGIPFAMIVLICYYFTFKLTVPLYFMSMKLALKWYTAMKK